MQSDILGLIPEPTSIGRSGRHQEVHPLAWEYACKLLEYSVRRRSRRFRLTLRFFDDVSTAS